MVPQALRLRGDAHAAVGPPRALRPAACASYAAAAAAAAAGGAGGAGGGAQRARRTNRGVGISAEPQSLRNLQDLTSKTFPEFKKSDG